MCYFWKKPQRPFWLFNFQNSFQNVIWDICLRTNNCGLPPSISSRTWCAIIISCRRSRNWRARFCVLWRPVGMSRTLLNANWSWREFWHRQPYVNTNDLMFLQVKIIKMFFHSILLINRGCFRLRPRQRTPVTTFQRWKSPNRWLCWTIKYSWPFAAS